MFLVTAEEMRSCDRRTIEEHGIPGPLLMERAGIAVVRALRRRFRPLFRRRIWIVCGRGNNGGDGLVVARLLHDDGFNPRVFLTDPPEEIGGDAGLQIDPLRCRRIPLEPVTAGLLDDLGRLGPDDLLVDAILGTGFQGKLGGEKAALVEAMNASPAKIVAVDIPSGLVADRGTVEGPAVRAVLTVTMGYAKRSFLFWPAREHVGEWEVADIGIPQEVEAAVSPVARLLTGEEVARNLPPFPRDAHKGIRGKVAIAGGSPGLTGAPCLAALGAARAGAGLVRVVVPRSLNPILEAKLTEPMTFPAAETEGGTLAPEVGALLLSLRDGWDALVFGPGLGRHRETDRLVREVYRGWPGPLVIDADGLNGLAGARLPRRDPRLVHPVLTPHPGEMERLSGRAVAEILSDPIAAATDFARRHRVVLLLKGAPTVVSDPEGRVFVSPTGNPGLGTGGSGDVLSGMIGAFLAQRVEPWWAAASAAYLHGLSADLLVARSGERTVTPSEVAAHLAEAWAVLEGRGDG